MVANHLMGGLVHGIKCRTTTAFANPAAIVAQNRGGIAAPVEEKHDLVALIQMLAALFNQKAATGRFAGAGL